MPKGMILSRLDEQSGVIIDAKFPEDITKELTNDVLLAIFSTYDKHKIIGITSMKIKKNPIVAYYSEISINNIRYKIIVALLLFKKENVDSYKETFMETARMVLNSIEKPNFQDLFSAHFNNLCKMKTISDEQRYCFIFRDKIRNLILKKLIDGAITKESLLKWLSEELKDEVFDINGILSPLLRTDLIKEINVNHNQEMPSKFIFLLKDFALIRIPNMDIFDKIKSDQLNLSFLEKYHEAVERFFNSYKISEEDSRKVAKYICNQNIYAIINILRNGYMTKEQITQELGEKIPNLDNHLKELEEKEIIMRIKDDQDREWFFLLTDIQAMAFFPEYMIDVIKKRWKEGTIEKEIALKHLELLSGEFSTKITSKVGKKDI